MEGIILKECTEADADLPPNPSRWTFAKRPDGQFFAKLYDGTILYLAGDVSAFVARLTYLENNEIKIPYFEIVDISAGTAGVLTIPTGATISLDEFKLAEDAVLSTLSGTQPSFESPLSGGTPIGVTLDGAGNWNTSGTYPSLVALIYVLKISLADFQNLDQDKYLPLDETSFQREPLIIPGTTAQYYRGDKTFQNLEPAVLATILAGLSLATGVPITNTDSVIVAMGKLQKQITDQLAALALHIADMANPHGVTKTQVGLGNVQNLDQTDPNNIVQDPTNRFTTDIEKALWNSNVHFRGKYLTLVALQTAIPVGVDGDYAIVDPGPGTAAIEYIWDTNEGWVQSGASSPITSVNGYTGPAIVLTTTDISEGVNLYYTLARFNTAFAAKTTTDLAEGANLYYTAARFNSAFAAKTTTDLAEGINLYYTAARFNAAFATKSTTDLAEGVNLYYTAARFNAAFAAKTTTDLAEGLNLYYTAARFNAAFAAKTTTDLAEGLNLYFTEARVRSTILTGLSLATGSDVAAADNILVAIGKLQNQAIRKAENIFSNTADVLINFNAVSASFTNFFTMTTTANDTRITDGRSMRIKGIGVFNKTAIGNSTYEVEANVAGTSMVVGAFSVGVAVIGNQIWEWELVLNFRTANQARARFTVLRRNGTSELASYSVLPALITFNKTLANNITFGVRIVASGTTNDLTRTHGTAVIE